MKLLDFAVKTAKKAGKLILEKSEKTLTITEKAKNDLVTNADLASEKLIIKEINSAYPDHAILAEESRKNPHKTLELFTNSKYT